MTTAADAEPRTGAAAADMALPGVVAMATNRTGTIHERATGWRVLDPAGAPGEPMTMDTVFVLLSMTKAVTATAALQLVEEGRLDLDAPARLHAPAIGALQVLTGFDAEGRPQMRPPKRDITPRMLLLHTAGLAYPFFNESYRRLVAEGHCVDTLGATRAGLNTPLLFDPGDAWEYGSGLDWVGQVVEGVTGARLGEVMRARIFEPLGMTDTAFTLTPSMRARLAGMHRRDGDGTLQPMPDFALPPEPEVHMGGHGLYGTVGDYVRFIRMWLNDGMGQAGRVLRADTIRMAERNGLGDRRIRMLPGVMPMLSNDAELFPGLPKSWSLSFMVNEEDAPTGRPAGALGWAGLANLYYWIDRRTGVGGVWASQLLPFADPAALSAFYAFETSIYKAMSGSAAEAGGGSP
ncbi:serine hydrolase domain-containing protein [Roseospira visakhapatnamensis]|uniref:Methyl acetate hydrolase n=1 Tax=Roseospira visakhapatnamensis TaxID=390880 RepID=A0A7W6RCF0_9PROT|nr:serine hydrolase domain-containing protein [Roseospira visakhapatnamensis]MBB4265439.1 methyl acetate hydrolase [Roseospira visakhapatnamensis]